MNVGSGYACDGEKVFGRGVGGTTAPVVGFTIFGGVRGSGIANVEGRWESVELWIVVMVVLLGGLGGQGGPGKQRRGMHGIHARYTRVIKNIDV